jgi:ABC-type lipoprotein release transport system permease subunit
MRGFEMWSAIVRSAPDLLVFGMAFLCVGLAALAASTVPATQAMRIDPAEALRAART